MRKSVLAGVTMVLLLAAGPSTGQTTDGTRPRTAWGEPDLQGIWTNATITRLERPEGFSGREFLTEEEVAELEQRAARNQFTDRAPRAGDPGTYNQVWFDRGTQVVASGRTSLIIDPPDGRIPWTPEASKHYERSRARYGVSPFDSWLDMDTVNAVSRTVSRWSPRKATT